MTHSRFPGTPVVRPVILVLSLLLGSALWAATPVIRLVGGDDNHNFGQASQWILVDGENFDGTVTDALFSASGGGTVAATNKLVSTGRGMLFCQVPPTAVTGTIQIRVDGISSVAYPFTVNAGTFNPGANTISGQITVSGVPLAGAGVALLKQRSCGGGMDFWTVTATDGSGFYTVNWPGSGSSYMLFLLPPRSAGVAGTAMPVSGSGNLTQNFALAAGTTVTGRVLNASSAAVANAEVSFDGNGYDKVMTDVSGNFSLHLEPGSWSMSIYPPVGYHARPVLQEAVTVPVSTPYPLGDRTLPGGVWVYGVLQDDTTPTPNPVVGAYVSAGPQNGGSNYSQSDSLPGGVFGLEVPMSTAIQLNIQTARTGPLVDLQQSLGPFSVDTNVGTITLVHAGFITGTVTDEALVPVANVGMQATHTLSHAFLSWNDTCSDGTYILKVPSAGTTVPVWVSTGFWNDPRPYAFQTYNDKRFECDGATINVTGTATVSGINFSLHPGGSVSGTVSQYSGGAPLPGIMVLADDGNARSCSLGGGFRTDGAGFYQLDHLPIVPMRFWAENVGPTYSRGSYTNKIYPQYTAVTPVAGSVTPNINIALRAPVAPKTVPDGTGGTQAAKLTKLNADGSLIQGTWDVTTCPPPTNHDYNLIVGTGSTLSTYTPVGSLCGLGLSGTYTGAAPAIPNGERFLWFVLVQTGGSGQTESSWGTATGGAERHGSAASGMCQDTLKDTSGTCP